jgi:hypothetical protein
MASGTPTLPAWKQEPRCCVREPGSSLPINLLGLVAFPLWAFAHLPWSYLRRACPSLFRLLSCTSPGHHAAPGCFLQSL